MSEFIGDAHPGEGLAFRRRDVRPDVSTPWTGPVAGVSLGLPVVEVPRLARLYTEEERDEAMGATVAEQQVHLGSGDFKAYHKSLTPIILKAINEDHVEFRFNTNKIILYPLDKDGPIFTVHARNSDRQLRGLENWYMNYVFKHLHSRTEEQPKPEPEPQPKPEPPRQRVRDVVDRPHPTAIEVTKAVQTLADVDAGWRPYVNSSDEVDERFEFREGKYRCTQCADTDQPFETDSPRSLAGHWRMKHGDRGALDSPEAREKATDTRRYRALAAEVEVCIDILASRIGMEHRSELQRLRAENADLRARLEMIQEAMRA